MNPPRTSTALDPKDDDAAPGEALVLDGEGMARLRRELAAWRTRTGTEVSGKFPPPPPRFPTW
jgi:hypothetical protein